MKAVRRLGEALLAAALALAPAGAFAQQSPAPASTTDAVGPGGLQNFSLSGTVTKPADQPGTAPAPKPSKQSPAVEAPPVARAAPTKPAPAPAAAGSKVKTQPVQRSLQPTHQPSSPPAFSPLPNVDTGSQLAPTLAGPSPAPTTPSPKPTVATTPAAAFPPVPPSPAHGGFPMLPWLFAALALGAGGAFLFWRNRLRQAAPAGPLFDLFAPAQPTPEAPPVPAPAPAPPPVGAPASAAPKPKATSAAPSGIVSARLRPWIDMGFQPLRCILEEQRVTVEFEVELFNSGSSPARAVLVEATLFNAGPTQDEEIARFFANPAAAGDRIPVIQPLKRMAIRSQVTVPRGSIQSYDVGGRQVFVPLIAFNTLYSMPSGDAQTSVSYLLGRDTQGEKLAPFRLDLGPRIFRGLAARLLPTGIRR